MANKLTLNEDLFREAQEYHKMKLKEWSTYGPDGAEYASLLSLSNEPSWCIMKDGKRFTSPFYSVEKAKLAIKEYKKKYPNSKFSVKPNKLPEIIVDIPFGASEFTKQEYNKLFSKKVNKIQIWDGAWSYYGFRKNNDGTWEYYQQGGSFTRPVSEDEVKDSLKRCIGPKSQKTRIAGINAPLYESLKEGLFEHPYDSYDETKDETPATPEENGVARLILHAINGETDTIAEYNDLIANTDNEDIIRIIQDITAEENNHIGMLQKALELISPNASNIDDGMEEAEEMIEETGEVVEESLTEADTLHQKFKKDIKNEYKSWANRQERTEQKRKDMMDILNDHPEVSDETRKSWMDKVDKLYPNQEFEYDFPRNLEKIDYPFYVTYYAEYPIYEPAEGGYYYAGNDAIWSEGFNTEEEAWEYADKYVEQDDEWGDWQKFTDGYKLDGKYIGQDQYVIIEPKKAYLGMVKGWEPYQ